MTIVANYTLRRAAAELLCLGLPPCREALSGAPAARVRGVCRSAERKRRCAQRGIRCLSCVGLARQSSAIRAAQCLYESEWPNRRAVRHAGTSTGGAPSRRRARRGPFTCLPWVSPALYAVRVHARDATPRR